MPQRTHFECQQLVLRPSVPSFQLTIQLHLVGQVPCLRIHVTHRTFSAIDWASYFIGTPCRFKSFGWMESLPFTIQRRLLPAFAAVLSSMLGSNRLMMYALAMYWCIGMKNFLVLAIDVFYLVCIVCAPYCTGVARRRQQPCSHTLHRLMIVWELEMRLMLWIPGHYRPWYFDGPAK